MINIEDLERVLLGSKFCDQKTSILILDIQLIFVNHDQLGDVVLSESQFEVSSQVMNMFGASYRNEHRLQIIGFA